MPLDPNEITVVPDDLVRDPIAWFAAHHVRCRRVCQLIDDLAGSSGFEEAAIRFVLTYLAEEAPRHLADEEEHLFPALRRSCEAEDEVNPVLVQLLNEHREDSVSSEAVSHCLRAALDTGAAVSRTPGATSVLHAYAMNERAHLALENAVVLPFARLRLSTAEMNAVSDGIALSRGLEAPTRLAS